MDESRTTSGVADVRPCFITYDATHAITRPAWRLLLQLVHRMMFMKMKVLTIVWVLLIFSRLLSHP